MRASVYTCEFTVIDAFLLGGLEPFVGDFSWWAVHAVAAVEVVFMCAPRKHVSVATRLHVAALFVCWNMRCAV